MAITTLPIEQIEIIPLDVVPSRKRRIPTGDHNYGGAGSWVGRPVVLRIRSGGISGWGEVRPVNPFVGETAAGMFASIRDFYGPLILGRDAVRIESILSSCERLLPANPGALALVDMALHDLVGRALNVPIHVLLGGACRDKMPMEWSVGLADEKTMVDEALMAVEKYGVPYVCVKVGPTENLDFDARVVNAMSDALGPNMFFGIDANTTYTAVGAARLVSRMPDVNLAYFEQPVPADSLNEMKWIHDQSGVSILADESVYTAADAARVIESGAADVLGTKLYKCGGLRRSREVAVIAAAAGLRVNCAGTANGSYIEAIAGAHLCASIPNHAFGAEFMMGLPAVEEDPLVRNRPVDIRDGHCNVPMEPGLGVDIDETVLQRVQMAHEIVRR